MDLTDEGDVNKYLKVEIEQNKEDKSITSKKTFLIQRAIELAGLSASNQVEIPAVKPPLSNDLEGASRTSTWEYQSIISLLNYISGSSRPDIAYATHSAASFPADPKASYNKGVKRIINYLKGTKENGLIMYQKMMKDSNVSLMRILQEDGQRTNLTIQLQFILVQDILLSIRIVHYYGRLN